MVSILKNQLIKHLSRYTKNLSSDKINISTFRGEGELSNLQLDEDVLTDLLELPAWLRITSAWCNHVSFRVSWTKLKTVPIMLCLDEVNITIETCEVNLNGKRNSNAGASAGAPSITSPQGKYSFIHKVIDGITIVVNTVNVKFHSPAFTSSVQMSRIRVESKSPKWLPADLRVTRLKDTVHGHLLIFKELSWQTVRIEASSTQDRTLTPLRLLTNQARCRITIKKKLSDCSILSSRLVLILDDLLWVLTDSQLKAALHFVDSLASLIKASTSLTQKTKAQKKLASLPEYQTQRAQQTRQPESSASSGVAAEVSPAQKSFDMFDVRETSYHFFSQRIDLHLCDDAGDGRSCYPDLNDGGALQISVQGFQVDYYPFHLAMTGRSHWPKYKEASIPPALWLEQSMNTFRETLLDLGHPNRHTAHAPLERCQPGPSAATSPQHSATSSKSSDDSHIFRSTIANLNKLMSSCVVLRIEDFTLYQVTTSGKKQMPKEFISGDKDRYSFPAELSTIHAEYTYFYFPGDFVFPLPPNKIFVHVNPVQVHFHLDSCLWLNSFVLNLHESLLRTAVMNTDAATAQQRNDQSANPTTEPPNLMYMDVKLEVIMPRVIIECPRDAPAQRDRPKSMQIQVSRLACTNIRELGASRADLAQALHSLQEGNLVFASDFPAKADDLCVVTDRILAHVAATDRASDGSSTPTPNTANTPTTAAFTKPPTATHTRLSRYSLWSEPRDVWCVKIDPLWIDFLGARSVGQSKTVPFVDAVPITLWLHGRSSSDQNDNPLATALNATPPPPATSKEPFVLSVANLQRSLESDPEYRQNLPSYTANNPFALPLDDEEPTSDERKMPADDDPAMADLHVIAHISNLVSVQIDHFQFLFLLRLAEEITELTTFLSLDSNRIMQNTAKEKSIVLGCVIPQLEVTMVMPSQTPGKESSGCGDAESVIPDSASLGDDLHISHNATWQTQLSLDQSLKNGSIAAQRFGSIETPSPVTTEQLPSFEQPPSSADVGGPLMYTSNPNTHGHNVQIVSSPERLAGGPGAKVDRPPSAMVTSTGSVSSQMGAGTPTPNRSRNRGSVSDTSFKEFGSSLISMKKGFSNFMTSIDSALKTGTADDASDTFSIQSDISSDSENFMLVLADDKTADCMDVMFRLNPFTSDENNIKVSPIEVASEVCEEQLYKTNNSSPSEPSEANSWRRRDLVSMVTFRLTTVELIRQNAGRCSSVRLQVAALACDECSAIPWDELQTKFGARCRAWNIAPYNPEAPPCLQLRMDETLQPPDDVSRITDKKTVLDWFDTTVEIRVKDLRLDMAMSTVIGLADLAEDEIIAKPLPIRMLLENLRLHLVEDRPPVNITSPGSVPIDLHIGRMRVTRDASGTFHLQPLAEETDVNADQLHNHPDNQAKHKEGRDRELLALQLVMQQLKLDNERIKRKLQLSEKSTESVIVQSKNETDVLKTCLTKAQVDISTLLDEKRTLLDTIRSLQKQLMASTDHVYCADDTR